MRAEPGDRRRRVQQRLRGRAAGGRAVRAGLPAHAGALVEPLLGASLPALQSLAETKGYRLVGSNSAGNNAYFIRADIAEGLPQPSASDAYRESRYRESRDEQGELTYVAGDHRREPIGQLPVLDLDTGTGPSGQLSVAERCPRGCEHRIPVSAIQRIAVVAPLETPLGSDARHDNVVLRTVGVVDHPDGVRSGGSE